MQKRGHDSVSLAEQFADGVNICGVAQTVKERKAIGQDPRAERAQQYVFQRCFIGTLLAAQEAGENVEAEGHRLEAEEHDNEVKTRGHEHHSDAGKQQKGVVFAFLFLFNFEEFDGEQNHQGGSSEKERGKEKKEGIDDDGVVKPEQRAIHRYRDAQFPDRVGTKSGSRQRQPGVQIPFLDTEREINQQDAETKKRELDLGENDGSVSLQVIGQRAEKGNVHRYLAGLFCFDRYGNCRRRQFRALHLIEVGIHLLDNSLHRLFNERKKWLWIDADPESYENERDERGHFAEVQVRQVLVDGQGHRPEHHALVEP